MLGMAWACLKYECSEAESMQCIEETQEGYLNHECPQNYTCPVVDFDSVAPTSCVQKTAEVTEEPVCIKYMEEGEPCGDGQFCGWTLYCGRNSVAEPVCLPVKRLGHQCSSLAECREGTVCNAGRCIQMFSLGEGEAASTKVACKSARIKDGICLPESLTVGERPKPCTVDSDCTSSLGLPGTCVCAANKAGQAFCALHESDEPVLKYLKAARNGDVEEAAARVQKAVYYPLIKGTEDCWEDIIAEVVDYEEKDDIYEHCSAVFLLLSSVLFA